MPSATSPPAWRRPPKRPFPAALRRDLKTLLNDLRLNYVARGAVNLTVSRD